jgi:FkbM family methyltransferase
MYKINDYWYVPDLDFLSEKVKNAKEDSDYEKSFRIFVKENHPRKNVMLDVGANIGIYSRPCSQFFKKIYSAEPIPKILECLKLNVKECSNIEIFEYGIGKKNPEAKFLYNPKNSGNTRQITKESQDVSNLVFSKIIPLDEIKLEELNYIKIDVEGFELDVLTSGENTIKNNLPWIQVEINNNQEDIEKFLNSIADYEYIPIKSKHNRLYVPKEGKNKL